MLKNTLKRKTLRGSNIKTFLDEPGGRIAYLRSKMGLSQKELANAIDFSHLSINNYEGNKALPSKEFIEKATSYFNCPDDFIENGIPNDSMIGIEALDILRKTPGIDITVVDFLEDLFIDMSVKVSKSQKYDEMMRLVIKLKKELDSLKK